MPLFPPMYDRQLHLLQAQAQDCSYPRSAELSMFMSASQDTLPGPSVMTQAPPIACMCHLCIIYLQPAKVCYCPSTALHCSYLQQNRLLHVLVLRFCRRPNYATSLAKRGSVPIRDETGRFIGVRPKTAAERLQRQTVGSGGIFKSAAVQVLRLEKRLMATGEHCHDYGCLSLCSLLLCC